MGDRLRLAVGVICNAVSLSLYAAPIVTFSRVIKKKSTEEFSCVPYAAALLTSSTYAWYGLPVVSHRWENFPLITINGLGALLELTFIIIYFWFASAEGKVKAGVTVITVIIAMCTTVIVSTFAFHDHQHRKAFVGSIGLLAGAAMYASPLVVMKQVIQTKSVEFMPFYLSFFSFLSSSFWLAYGLLSHDLFIALPNLVGSPLSILQLVLYFKYRKTSVMKKPNYSCDLEKNNHDGHQEKSKQLQIVSDDKSNGHTKNADEEYA